VKGRGHSEDLVVDGRIILECVLKEYGVKMWTGLNWLMIGTYLGLL
jgi:hypothetical protein